jgi:hypothetical protein
MVFDTLEPEAVEDNLYNGWLAALRVLSKPTTAPNYPEAMRTRAWAMKTLNTQLASWTQLRHDTIAYVKQSVTAIGICSYPEGYVEPAPEFYCLMQHLSQKAADAVGLLHLQGITHIETNDVINFGGDVDLGQFKTNMVLFLNRFASTMGVLQGIALKELACQPLNEAETRFLRNVVQLGLGYLGVLEFNGWYPRLFYKSNEGMDWRLENYFYDPRTLQYVEGRPAHDSDVEDILVADVHTDPPDTLTPDPGAVLHEGVGRVYIMLIAVDSGPDRMVYAGPVFSHFEFLEPYGTRLNDGEWKDHVLAGDRPAHPEWTRDYLVPSGRP